MAIGQTVAEMAIFRFFKMAAVRHLEFVVCVPGPPTLRKLVGIDAVASMIRKF